MTTAPPLEVRPLSLETWDAFSRLVERNGGIFGGCWCAPNHVEYNRRNVTCVEDNRDFKRDLVAAGRVHQTLVLDGDGEARGWCQFGRPDELRMKHLREYQKGAPPQADWRIACIFTDRTHRRQGIARAAVAGALEQIRAEGGGRVEAISETTDGRVAQGRFLFSGSVELYEDLGFRRERQVGKHAWLVGAAL